MNQSHIKYLAALLMVIDHAGILLESDLMRVIGRLSFPLFAYIFAKNWERPGSKEKLLTRLVLFGTLSQIPYILLFHKLSLNIMFTFAAVGIIFSCIRKFDRKISILIIGMIAAQLLNVDYGWYGVLVSLMMISFKGGGNRMWWTGWSTVNLLYAGFSGSAIQLMTIFAPIILGCHQPTKDKKPTEVEKRFFYYFYPIHLGVLAALRTII